MYIFGDAVEDMAAEHKIEDMSAYNIYTENCICASDPEIGI